MVYLGIDLAWLESSTKRAGNSSGVVLLDASGRILSAGWTLGIADTVLWITDAAKDHQDALIFVDAPLVVDNHSGQRLCETRVGERYGRWRVSANSTNLRSKALGGVALRFALEANGWRYDNGWNGPPTTGRAVSECYPYTTLVGAEELGYDRERPTYKRKPKNCPRSEWRVGRALACDDLIQRLAHLSAAIPPLDLKSCAETRVLVQTPSPVNDIEYKRREDLLDAVVCAWTAAFWHTHGPKRCQVLGATQAEANRAPLATIIAPARPEQRR